MLSASELAYLAGSKYVEVSDDLDPDFKSALVALKRGAEDLAVTVVASALLSLRDEGAISMEYAKQKALGFIPSRAIVYASTGTTNARERTLEYRLASHFGGKPRGTNYLVEHAIPLSRSAVNTTLQLTFEALLGEGILHREPLAAAAVTTRHSTKTPAPAVVTPEALALTIPALRGWALRWAVFNADESVLAKALTNEVHAAIRRRTQANDSDDWGD